MIVAIDGPAASGKSTAAIGVAKALNITHLDTGAMYRAVTFSLIKNQINFKDVKAVAGHSLGEYSALVAANSISFSSSVKLLEIRSKAMQESMPVGTGGMAAIIGKSMIEVEEIIASIKKYGIRLKLRIFSLFTIE